ARRVGVRPAMTVSQAIGLCPTLKLCEADPVHYDERFSALLASLSDVSPVIEPAELGRVFVGLDGLEGVHGNLVNQINTIEKIVSDCRIGVARGKFISWVAASRSKIGSPTIVSPGTDRRFLGSQPLAVLPLDTDTHRRLLRLGLTTLNDL